MAKTNGKTRRLYPNVFAQMRDRFCLLLTDEQIAKYAKGHDILKRDIPNDIFDTIDRDLLIDEIVQDVIGSRWHWPLYGDEPAYARKFYANFYRMAQVKGIQVTKPIRDDYPVALSSQQFVDYVVEHSRLPKLIEHWAWRYLAAGDQAHTSQGGSLATMFQRFDNSPEKIMADFEKWVIITLVKDQPLPKL